MFCYNYTGITDIHTYITHGNIFIPTYSLCPSSSHKKSKDKFDEKFNFKKTHGQGSREESLSNAPGKKLSVLGVEVGRREGKNQQRAEGAHGRDTGGQESARTRLEAAVQKLTIPSLPPEAARQNTLEKKSTRESKP